MNAFHDKGSFGKNIPSAGPGFLEKLVSLLKRNEPVGVAFSGGADSTAALFWTIRVFGRERVVALHYHHGVRGEKADADLLHASVLCEHERVEFRHAARSDRGPATENELRRLRIAFFEESARGEGLCGLVQGHHADDVAETLLMRLGRGSGSGGLSAPRPVSRLPSGLPVLRPLLRMRKTDIMALLSEAAVAWRTDETNELPEIATRNRVRLGVAGAWIAALPGDAVAGASRTRELLQDDDDALDALARERMENHSGPGGLFERLPRAIARRVLHLWFARCSPEAEPSSAAFDALLDALLAGEPHALSLDAETTLRFDGAALSMTSNKAAKPSPEAVLPVPGFVFFPDGARIEAVVTERGESDDKTRVHIQIPAHATLLCGALRLGERYTPLGAPGSRKISDAMIDRKIPASVRKELPVVRAGSGVLWIPGLLPAASHRLAPDETRALRLTWRPAPAP